MTTVQVTLPFPPSANRLWRSVPGLRSPIKSKEYREWLKDAAYAIPMDARGLIRAEHEIVMIANRPDRRARDLDNLLKPLLDSLKDQDGPLKGVIRDDSDTRKITIGWAGDEPVKSATVTIWVTSREEVK